MPGLWYQVGILKGGLITFLYSTCGISCKSYEQSHKLSGEDSSVPIFCTKTFMALKKSLEDAEMVERLWVEKSRSKGRLSLSFDATKEEYFSVRVLSGIRFKEEDLIIAEEIYKQYESGDIAETWNQDKRNVV